MLNKQTFRTKKVKNNSVIMNCIQTYGNRKSSRNMHVRRFSTFLIIVLVFSCRLNCAIEKFPVYLYSFIWRMNMITSLSFPLPLNNTNICWFRIIQFKIFHFHNFPIFSSLSPSPWCCDYFRDEINQETIFSLCIKL